MRIPFFIVVVMLPVRIVFISIYVLLLIAYEL